MKIFRLLAFGMAVVMWTSTPVRAASDDVSAVAAETPVADVLQMYGIISGKKVIPTDEVRALKLSVNFKITKTPKAEAQHLIEAALLRQAGVKLVPMPDGTTEARLVGTRNWWHPTRCAPSRGDVYEQVKSAGARVRSQPQDRTYGMREFHPSRPGREPDHVRV